MVCHTLTAWCYCYRSTCDHQVQCALSRHSWEDPVAVAAAAVVVAVGYLEEVAAAAAAAAFEVQASHQDVETA